MTDPRRVRLRINGDRRALRSRLINAFLEEEPGTGRGDLCSRNIYEVERTLSGHTIELHRPANRNNGMDFTVRCPTITFNYENRLWRHVPRHEDLVTALQGIRRRHPAVFGLVRDAIGAIYRCQRVRGWRNLALLSSEPMGANQTVCPADVAVLVAKWLFVEQDVTYWHNSGRAMTYEYLQDERVI